MSLIKLSDKCPDIKVRRIRNTDHDYRVTIDGEEIEEEFTDGNWSRHIFISKKHRVVVKIDDDYYRQSRNEVVFWTEKVKGEDRRHFAPVLGWGTTSVMLYRSKRVNDKWVDYKSQKRVFYCVQQYIWGAKEIEGPKYSGVYSTLLNVVDEYGMADFHYRQCKANNRGNVKIHDYGLFGDYDTRDLPSDRIPRLAGNVKLKNYLEKVGG